jgi:lysophospholipase L1-like esterase
MSNRTFLRRLGAAVSVPVAVLGLLASPTATGPAAAAPPTMSSAAVEGYAPLRIMPLGDSITFGVGSQHLDGYRPSLYRRLTSAGLGVDFVGSLHNGGGPDADNEGHKGWTIERVANHLDDWLATYQPDVILLHIGTNDMAKMLPGAAGRLDALLDQIAADRPDAEVFVAQVTGLAD